MKKIKALMISMILSIVLSSFVVYFYEKRIDNTIKVDNNSIRYNTLYSKYNSYDILVNNIDENTILLMGSSELVATIDEKEHPKQLLDYSDKHIMQIGGGHYQSLIHSTIIGSIGNDIPIRKVNLIISMQWFTKKGIEKEAFESRVSFDHLYRFFENKNISINIKDRVYERISKLTGDSSIIKTEIDRVYKPTIIEKILNPIFKYKHNISVKKEFYDKYKKDNTFNTMKYSDLDWEKLEKDAIETAKNETTNNEFFIENNYYDEYIKLDLKKYKNYMKDENYSNSPEYEDLEIFIDISKELGFDVNIILIPLQGKWADYTGVPKSSIYEFYDKIRELAKSKEIVLTDYSSYSYTPYFFHDIMHLGRLGFLKLQRDLI